MAHTPTLPTFSSTSGLSRYLTDIRKFPLLEAEQEYKTRIFLSEYNLALQSRQPLVKSSAKQFA